MRGSAHPPEVKAAVMAALLAGQSVEETAKQYKLPESSVRTWSRDLSGEQFAKIRAKKDADFDNLVATFLRETLTTLSVQARFFREETWLREQDAPGLAVLHGVQTDKAVRLLEAYQLGQSIASNEFDGEDAPL